MAVLSGNKVLALSQATNPRLAITKAVGDLSNEHVLYDLVLVGTFIRNERTPGGIIRPKENVEEDVFQGKVGLVLQMGPLAGEDQVVKVGDWIVYSIKDGWAVTINGAPCRLVPYERIRMKLSDPNVVF